MILCHGRHDLVEDHDTHNGQKYGTGGRQIRSAHPEFLTEDNQKADYCKIRQSGRKRLVHDIVQKMALDPFPVKLQRHDKRRNAGLTTPKQIRLLERKGFQHVGTWTFEQASNMINRIAANGWRIPAGINPRTYGVNYE